MGEPSRATGVGTQAWDGMEISKPIGKGDVGGGIDLVLVGKMISNKPFNKAGLRGPIYRAWHFVKDLVMEEVEGDRFFFTFPSVEVKRHILEQSPWNIKGFPLVLKPLAQGGTMLE